MKTKAPSPKDDAVGTAPKEAAPPADSSQGYLVFSVARDGRVSISGNDALATWLQTELARRGIHLALRSLGPCG